MSLTLKKIIHTISLRSILLLSVCCGLFASVSLLYKKKINFKVVNSCDRIPIWFTVKMRSYWCQHYAHFSRCCRCPAIDDAEMVWPALQLHWTKDDHVSRHDVLHCCRAMCLHCYLIAAAANDSTDDSADRPVNVPAAVDHCSTDGLGVPGLWRVNMQSNCFYTASIKEKEKRNLSFSWFQCARWSVVISNAIEMSKCRTV